MYSIHFDRYVFMHSNMLNVLILLQIVFAIINMLQGLKKLRQLHFWLLLNLPEYTFLSRILSVIGNYYSEILISEAVFKLYKNYNIFYYIDL